MHSSLHLMKASFSVLFIFSNSSNRILCKYISKSFKIPILLLSEGKFTGTLEKFYCLTREKYFLGVSAKTALLGVLKMVKYFKNWGEKI